MDWHFVWSLVLSLVAALLAVISTLLGMLWRQQREEVKELKATVVELGRVAVTRGELDERFKEIQSERLRMHEENKEVLGRIEGKIDRNEERGRDAPAVEARLAAVEKEVDALREWKHEVVDPYIPAEITSHERRITTLEGRGGRR